MFADYYDDAPEESQPLTIGQKVWCVLMLLVILASAATMALFLQRELNPVSEPAVTLDLADLTPQPGFDL